MYSFNPKTEMIPGLRRPTAQEQAWIGAQWGPEARRTEHRTKGKLSRYTGIFLIAISAVGMTRQEVDLAGLFVVLTLAVLCFVVSFLNRRAYKQRDCLFRALEQGDYLVAPAVSVKLCYGQRGNSTRALAYICLPDGRMLDSIYRLPYQCAKPLIEQNIHRVPVLLIRFSGYPSILSIPVNSKISNLNLL